MTSFRLARWAGVGVVVSAFLAVLSMSADAQSVALRARLDQVLSDATALSARIATLNAEPLTPATSQERALAERRLSRLRADETSLRSEIDRLDGLARSEGASR